MLAGSDPTRPDPTAGVAWGPTGVPGRSSRGDMPASTQVGVLDPWGPRRERGPWGRGCCRIPEAQAQPGGQGGSGGFSFPRHQARVHSRGAVWVPSRDGATVEALLGLGSSGAGGGALRPGRLAPPCDVHVRTPVRDAGRRARGAARTRLDRELGALPGGGRSPARGSCLPAAPGSFAVSQPQPRPRLQRTPVGRAAPQPGGCGSPGAEMGPGP